MLWGLLINIVIPIESYYYRRIAVIFYCIFKLMLQLLLSEVNWYDSGLFRAGSIKHWDLFKCTQMYVGINSANIAVIIILCISVHLFNLAISLKYNMYTLWFLPLASSGHIAKCFKSHSNLIFYTFQVVIKFCTFLILVSQGFAFLVTYRLLCLLLCFIQSQCSTLMRFGLAAVFWCLHLLAGAGHLWPSS